MRTKKSPKRANIAKINFVAVRPLRGRFVVISVQNMNVLKRCVFFSF